MTKKMAASRKPCLCCSELKSKCFGLGSKKCEVLNVKSNLQLLFIGFSWTIFLCSLSSGKQFKKNFYYLLTRLLEE